MKEIELTKGYVAIVDDEDYEWLSQWEWKAWTSRHQSQVYAERRGDGERMHRTITNAPKGVLVDHKNGNSLDNRRENLRLCTTGENQQNKRKMIGPSSSPFKGVSWCKQARRWRAQIMLDRKHKCLGRYVTQIEAAIAYNDAATRYFGEFALLNDLTNAPPEAYVPVSKERKKYTRRKSVETSTPVAVVVAEY